MKAMVFAAGLGTRLRPVTDRMPKALVSVGGKPMLQHVIERLAVAGVDEMVINVHHFPDQIISFLRDNDDFGLKISVSDERGRLLDTGGGLLHAARWLAGSEPVIVHNADIFTDAPLRTMYEAHLDSGADATLLTSQRSTSRYLLFDGGGLMRGWKNVTSGEVRPAGMCDDGLRQEAFGGVHVVSQSVLSELCHYAADGDVFSIMPFYIDACAKMEIRSFRQPDGACWFDIGKPQSLSLARDYAASQFSI